MWMLYAFIQLWWSSVRVTWRRLWRGRRHPLWTWRVEVLADFLRRGLLNGLDRPLVVMRERIPAGMVPGRIARQLTVERNASLGGRPAEIHTPSEWAPGDPVVLYFHGGGYIACSPATHRELVARIAVAAGARVLSLDYRLAPEHPFPAALDDAMAATKELLAAEWCSASKLFLAGDSAGGGLAMATLLQLREEGAALPGGAALLSPWVDLTLAGESLRTNADYTWVPLNAMKIYVEHYTGGTADPKNPLVSPLYGDLAGLPPLLIQTGSAEMIHSEIVDLAKRAEAAGTPVKLEVYAGMVHVFQPLARVLPEARTAIENIGAFVRARRP